LLRSDFHLRNAQLLDAARYDISRDIIRLPFENWRKLVSAASYLTYSPIA
jgi:hypothetical protein